VLVVERERTHYQIQREERAVGLVRLDCSSVAAVLACTAVRLEFAVVAAESVAASSDRGHID
jgi:hypothetical protein